MLAQQATPIDQHIIAARSAHSPTGILRRRPRLRVSTRAPRCVGTRDRLRHRRPDTTGRDTLTPTNRPASLLASRIVEPPLEVGALHEDPPTDPHCRRTMASVTQPAKRARLDPRQLGTLVDRQQHRQWRAGRFRSNRWLSPLPRIRLQLSNPVADVMQHLKDPLQGAQHLVLNLLIASSTTLIFIHHEATVRSCSDTNPSRGRRSRSSSSRSLDHHLPQLRKTPRHNGRSCRTCIGGRC